MGRYSKGVKEWKGKSLKTIICRLAWGLVKYHLWRQRNDVRFGNSLISEEKMIQKICWEVRNLELELYGRANLMVMRRIWPFVLIVISQLHCLMLALLLFNLSVCCTSIAAG
jgi:hypothetical protein